MTTDRTSNRQYYPEEYLDAAYDAGYEAYVLGYELNECPDTYPELERKEWVKGWKQARRDYL